MQKVLDGVRQEVKMQIGSEDEQDATEPPRQNKRLAVLYPIRKHSGATHWSNKIEGHRMRKVMEPLSTAGCGVEHGQDSEQNRKDGAIDRAQDGGKV